MEYEQFYQIWSDEPFPKPYDSIVMLELVNFYRKEMIRESWDNATELMQLYTDLGQYEKARNTAGKILKLYQEFGIQGYTRKQENSLIF